MSDHQPVVSAFAARQAARLTKSSGSAEVIVEKVEVKAAKVSVQDELLKGPSFVDAGKESRLFRSGLSQRLAPIKEDDGFSDDSPYDCDPEEEESKLRYGLCCGIEGNS